MWSQGGSDSVEMGPLEVLTWHKELLAFCAKIRAPQDGAKEYLILVKLPLSRSLLGLKSP